MVRSSDAWDVSDASVEMSEASVVDRSFSADMVDTVAVVDTLFVEIDDAGEVDAVVVVAVATVVVCSLKQ